MARDSWPTLAQVNVNKLTAVRRWGGDGERAVKLRNEVQKGGDSARSFRLRTGSAELSKQKSHGSISGCPAEDVDNTLGFSYQTMTKEKSITHTHRM